MTRKKKEVLEFLLAMLILGIAMTVGVYYATSKDVWFAGDPDYDNIMSGKSRKGAEDETAETRKKKADPGGDQHNGGQTGL